MAVHTDHNHIHAHIIFNNTNVYSGLSFTTEENQGGRRERAWAKLRQISDEICEEHKLSVIEQPQKSTGISHYERDMLTEGKSWKEKLRYKLSNIIIKSANFKDFLRRCAKKKIDVVFEPTHKYKLKFRLEGQQRYVRGETLGEDYTFDNIVKNIEIISSTLAEFKSKNSAVAPESKLPPKPASSFEQTPKTEVKSEPTAPNPPEKEIDKWAEIRGMGHSAEMIAELESAGIKSFNEFSQFFWLSSSAVDHSEKMKSLKKQFDDIDKLIRKMQHRDEITPTYKTYQSKKGLAKSFFKKKNVDTIEDYEQTLKYIKEHCKPYMTDGKPPKILDLMDMSNALKSEYNRLGIEQYEYDIKKTTAKKYTAKARRYLDDERIKRYDRKKQQERSFSRQRNKNELE